MAHYVAPSTESALILRNSAETITATFYNGETASNVSTGSMTVGIVDTHGNTIVSSGTATTSSSTGVYEVTLAAQADLKRLITTWSGTFSTAMTFLTQHEVVGVSMSHLSKSEIWIRYLARPQPSRRPT